MENLEKILFSEGEKRPVCLVNDEGKQVYFEQVFALSYGGENYCILKPLSKVEGAKGNTAFVFRLDGEDRLVAERDENTARRIFGEYYRTLKKSV